MQYHMYLQIKKRSQITMLSTQRLAAPQSPSIEILFLSHKQEDQFDLIEPFKELPITSQEQLQTLSYGADSESCDKDGNSVAMYLAQNGNVNLLSTISEEGIKQKNKSNATALHFAATKKHNIEVISQLTAIVDVNARESKGRTALMISAYIGDIEAVKILLDRKANINIGDIYGRTPLMAALQQGHTALATLLLEGGADVKQETNSGETALFYACRKVEDGLVRLLVKRDDRLLNHPDSNGNTLLMHAVKEKDLKCLKLLLSLGANVDVENKFGKTAIIEACLSGKLDIVKLLVENGASKTAVTSTGLSATSVVSVNGNSAMRKYFRKEIKKSRFLKIFAAIECRDLACVQQVLGEVHESNPVGFSPLMFACTKGYADVVWTILKSGVNLVNGRTTDGMMSLCCALMFGNTQVAELLLAFGANINLKDSDGRTPLHRCTASNNFDAVELLIRIGASLEVSDSKGKTPLDIAIENSFFEIEELLQKFGAKSPSTNGESMISLKRSDFITRCKDDNVDHFKDVNPHITDQNGRSLLSIAAEHGAVETLKYLLRKSANPNAVDKYGKSPLILAVEGQHMKAVQLLISKGAVMNIRDNSGKTALNYAICGGQEEIVVVLIENNASIGLVEGGKCIVSPDANVSVAYINAIGAKEFARGEGQDATAKLLERHFMIPLAIDITNVEGEMPNLQSHHLPEGEVGNLKAACERNNGTLVDTLLHQNAWSKDEIFEAVDYCGSNCLYLLLGIFQDNGANIVNILNQKKKGAETLAKLRNYLPSKNDKGMHFSLVSAFLKLEMVVGCCTQWFHLVEFKLYESFFRIICICIR